MSKAPEGEGEPRAIVHKPYFSRQRVNLLVGILGGLVERESKEVSMGM
jgi:hypothetical protein